MTIVGPGITDTEFGQYIGETTNNDAEYQAVIAGLTKLKKLLGAKARASNVEICLDSELVAKQMKREYKVKNPNLKTLFVTATALCSEFSSVEFRHIPREENSEADRLVNETLDDHLKKK